MFIKIQTKVKSTFFFCLVLILTIDTFAQTPTIDSLLNVLKTAKEDTIKVKLLNALSWESIIVGEYDTALQYSEGALKVIHGILAETQLTTKQATQKAEANAYNNIGIIQYYKGDYSNALEFYLKSVKIKEELTDKQGAALSYNNIGLIYERKGNYPKALEFHLKSLNIFEETGDKNGMALSYNNIGNVHLYKDDFEKALEFYLRSLKIEEDNGNKQGMALSYTNIGNIHHFNKNFSKALEFHFKSLQILEEAGDKQGMASCYNNIGSIHFDKGDYSLVQEFYLKALKIREEAGDKQGMAESFVNIGNLFLQENNLNEARKHLRKSLEIAKEILAMPDMMIAYEALAKVDSAMGNFKEAYENHKFYIAVRDSIFNEEASKKTVQAEMNFEFEKKEQATKLEQEKKDALALKELEKQTMQRNGFIGGFAFMLALAGVSYRSYRNKRKAHAVIAHQKELVEEKNKDITASINYAKRIQDALLKEGTPVSAEIPQHFILFKPKDIVSGDFYWSMEKQGHIYLAAVDCTGHGVPGAFMSMLGIAFLNEITATEKLLTPAAILDRLREKVIKELSQADKEGDTSLTVKDGMDMSIIRIDLATNELQWSGANNPLYVVNVAEREVKEIKGDKQPIGFSHSQHPFTNHTLSLKKEESIYIFTDGYADQFGGEKGKKFKYSKFKELLLSIQDKTMQEQKGILNETFETWKGNLEQVDDVCVIGVRL